MQTDTVVTTPVIAFEREEAEARGKHLKRLYKRCRETENAVDVAAYEAGLLDDPYISPGVARERLVGFHGLRCQEWDARVRLMCSLETQANKYKTLLRRALASDAVAEDDRQAILQGLYGLRGRQRDAKVFSEAEHKLIRHYREMSGADRQMLRTLLARLAESAADDREGA